MLVSMQAYSLDLREKILRACDQGLGSQRAIAALFGVSLSFVESSCDGAERPEISPLTAMAEGAGRSAMRPR
jgi:transposase